MQKIKEKTVAAMALPKEIVLDLPVIAITGRGEITIENYKNLLEFSDTTMIIRTKDGIITITGKDLSLRQVTSENLVITGHANGILFDGV